MKKSKFIYKQPDIELISFCTEDIMTSSGAFDGEEDVFDIH